MIERGQRQRVARRQPRGENVSNQMSGLASGLEQREPSLRRLVSLLCARHHPRAEVLLSEFRGPSAPYAPGRRLRRDGVHDIGARPPNVVTSEEETREKTIFVEQHKATQ